MPQFDEIQTFLSRRFSSDSVATGVDSQSTSQATVKNPDIMRMQVSFPTRLYNLLEAADKTIVDWLPNEKAFCVNDMERFVNVILPQYFNRKSIAYCNDLFSYTHSLLITI